MTSLRVVKLKSFGRSIVVVVFEVEIEDRDGGYIGEYGGEDRDGGEDDGGGKVPVF